MRRIACFMMAALSGALVSGQGLLDCIEPDVLHTLLQAGPDGQAPRFTATVPEEVSRLRVPAGFAWIGSAERAVMAGSMDAPMRVMQVTAAWRTNLGPDAAHAATAEVLASSGWEVRPLAGFGRAVFSPPVSQLVQAACRDGKLVNFNTGVLDDTTYVLLNLQRGNVGATVCTQRAPPTATAGSVIEPFLPRLDMPLDPGTGTAARLSTTGSSFGADKISARAEIIVKESATGVARHFARQMAEQGWTSEAQWAGASSSGSTWSKRPREGMRLHASLSVMAVDEQNIVAVFRVINSQ